MLRSAVFGSSCLRRPLSAQIATRVPSTALRLRSSLGGASSAAASSSSSRRKSSIDRAVGSTKQEGRSNPDTSSPKGDTKSETSSADGKKAPSYMGRFTKMARERGLAFALYLFIFGEAVTLFVTYLLHFDILGSGDVVAWLNWVGLDKLVDLNKYAGKHVTLFGFELSVRLLTNYGIANVAVIPVFPLEIAFCAYTLPYLITAARALKFWKGRGTKIPKAPQAEAAASANVSAQLPK